jgi:hypothetical protein
MPPKVSALSRFFVLCGHACSRTNTRSCVESVGTTAGGCELVRTKPFADPTIATACYQR